MQYVLHRSADPTAALAAQDSFRRKSARLASVGEQQRVMENDPANVAAGFSSRFQASAPVDDSRADALGRMSRPVTTFSGAAQMLAETRQRNEKIEANAAEICRLLLHEGGGRHGVRLLFESTIYAGVNPLEMAVSSGDDEVLNALLSTESDARLLLETPELREHAASSLRLSASLGNTKQITQLLVSGAAVDARSDTSLASTRLSVAEVRENGNTPVMLAVEHGHLDCLQVAARPTSPAHHPAPTSPPSPRRCQPILSRLAHAAAPQRARRHIAQGQARARLRADDRLQTRGVRLPPRAPRRRRRP